MDVDLDTLATALYVTTDDPLKNHPERVPARPDVGLPPRITDAELLSLAVIQALLGYPSERRGSGMHASTCWTCSRTCPDSPATTSGCGSWPTPCPGWSALSRPTPAS